MNPEADIDIKPLMGSMLTRDDLPPQVEDRKLTFYSRDGRTYMDIGESQLSKHFLVIGGVGSGKTNFFNLLLKQIDYKLETKDVCLIFDAKGDYFQEFYDWDYPDSCRVIGNSLSYAGITSYWNIFREIEYGGITRKEKELTAKEIAKSLFEDRKNESQPFFSDAACDIFSKVLIYQMRRELWESEEYQKLETYIDHHRTSLEECEKAAARQRQLFDRAAGRLNNRVLVEEILQVWDGKQYAAMLDSEKDFRNAKNYIGEGTSNQALGVLGEMSSMINDYFIGIFAEYEPGRDFSIRELVRQKGGRKIFIEYDLSIGQVLCPVYRLLIDLALKEALGRARSDGNVYLILDEFKLIPRLSHLEDSVNYGRSLGVKVFIGLQNISQVEDAYGETAGKVIVAGFSNIVAFRMTDEQSREYISDLFGHNYTRLVFTVLGKPEPTTREGRCVENWQLVDLSIGEAVVCLSGHKPFYFGFQEYAKTARRS